jgi:AGZA family xanthine/uracil permease-like MFS transporter
MIIPTEVKAPALFVVGLFMISPILKIDLNDFTEVIPTFFTLIMMSLTYSIADGIVFGMLTYVLLKLFISRFSKIKRVMYVIVLFFLLKMYI